MLAIDAGFSTQEVYAWVRAQYPNNVMTIKGVDNSLVMMKSVGHKRPKIIRSNFL
jgi:hypothetical protein